MAGTARILRHTAFTLMALFGLLGGLFVAGYAFEDPGGWAAAGLTALWVVPLVALSVFALLRPAAAAPVFVGVVTVVAVFTLADSALGIIPRNDRGPVAAVMVFALGVALAFLGLHRPRLAGLLMVATGLAQLAATLIAFAVHGRGPGPSAVLGGSSGVVVMPLLLVGVLFLLAGFTEHGSVQPPRQHHVGTAH